MEQIAFNFEAGLTERYRTHFECIRAAVYSCGKPFKNIVADLSELTGKEYTSSKLSRMLNESDDGINFPVQDLWALVEATGDDRIWRWMAEMRSTDPEDRRNRALRQIEALAPLLQAALKTLEQQA